MERQTARYEESPASIVRRFRVYRSPFPRLSSLRPLVSYEESPERTSPKTPIENQNLVLSGRLGKGRREVSERKQGKLQRQFPLSSLTRNKLSYIPIETKRYAFKLESIAL